ncbi:MAG: response regulator, partial [Nitrospirae bacterium]
MEEKTVLIVDDNETVLLALEFNLKSAGYRVLKASDGKEALSVALKDHPDIIVSDIAMPEMDGIELCRELRSRDEFAEVPFIFLTAHGEPEERVKGLKSGADDYVIKPFDIEELITRIDILYEKVKKRVVSGDLAGKIDEISIPDILQMLEQTGKEGKVIIKSGGKDGAIFIKQGIVTECVFGALRGEDAFVELMKCNEGTFAFKPQSVPDTETARPVGFLVMESARLLDEFGALSSYIPENSDTLSLVSTPEAESPEMDRILRILEKGSVTTGEAASLSGLSRIRTLVTIGKLNREGALKVVKSVEQTEKPSEPPVSKTPQLQIKPLKLLFLFCNEKAATESVNSILSAFNQKQIKGIKAGVADFIRAQILDHPVHIFTLQGKRGFEFLYEPLLPTSDAA